MSDVPKQMKAMRTSIEAAPAELEIADLFPVFAPTSFFELGNWPGPYDVLGVPGLCLTWAVMQPELTMRYVDFGVQKHWDSLAIPWRARAVENLQRQSLSNVWTHEFARADGSLFAVAMMHPDSHGPSRLLLNEPLSHQFPEGYLVAVPERSCGIVLGMRATASERADVERMVASCFEKGTRPLIPGLHEPSGLESRPSP